MGEAIVRRFAPADFVAVIRIAEGLPEWFDEDARKRAIPIDLRHQAAFVAVDGGEVVGFITLFVNEGRANIGWIGVEKGRHREGVGGMLMERAEEHARELGCSELQTMTLGESVDYPPYELTRSFYWKHGFTVAVRCQTDNPGCPEELHIVKKLAARNP